MSWLARSFEWLGSLAMKRWDWELNFDPSSDIQPSERPMNAPISPVDSQSAPSTVPAPVQASRVKIWALAVQHGEGGRPQDLNTINHNPGNLKKGAFTAGFPYISVDSRNFLVFSTYQDGFNSLCTFLTNSATGKYLPTYSPDMSLKDYCQKYGEPPDLGYAKGIAAECGVTIDTPIKDLI